MKLVILLSFFKLFCAVLCADPPLTWQENWYDHHELVTRVYFDNDVAIYYDKDVSKNSTWLNKYLHDLWVYTKKEYGQFGSDPHLYAIFHTNKHGGGHPATYFDALKSYRNVIDCGLDGDKAWTTEGDGELSLITHETSHIVELASKGVKGSPAFDIWGDSKWAEIFVYDIYVKLNLGPVAQRWYNSVSGTHDNFPRNNTYWFRDWFYPIYSKHGGVTALNSFFDLLSKHFPKANTASMNRPEYTRKLNHGEFFHFWSGAAKTNLKDLATAAFGWSDEYQQQFNKARTDFQNVHY